MPKKVSRGQAGDIPAKDWNALLQMLTDRQGGGTGEIDLGADPLVTNTGIVRVKNTSGSACDRLHVLGIDGPIFEPTGDAAINTFKGQVLLKGATPHNVNHKGKFFILLDPAADAAIARAWVSGVCPARVFFDESDHAWADVKHNDRTMLQSHATEGSARVLWKESGAGAKLAVVMLGHQFPFPLGQVQHQLLGMVAQHVYGYGLPLAHPDIIQVETD